MTTADPDLQQALALHRQGQLDRAAQLYRRVLSNQPQQLDALQMLGLAEIGLGNPATALGYFDRAIKLAPGNAILLFNRGLTLLQLQRAAEAVAAFDAALAVDARYAKAVSMKASAQQSLGRFEEAIQTLEQGLAAVPQDAAPALLQQKGSLLYLAGRFDDALRCFEQVLQAVPGSPDALVNMGTTLHRLGRHAEAVAVLDRSLVLNPDAPDALFNRGIALVALRRLPEAIASYSEALRMQPGLVQAWINRGVAHSQLQRYDAAIADLEQALRLQPAHVDTLLNLANAQLDAGQIDQAIQRYDILLKLAPQLDFVLDARMHAKLRICDWTGYDEGVREVEQRVATGGPRVAPSRLFVLSDAAALQKQCAQAYMRGRFPDGAAPAFAAPVAGRRIRIGYFSSDFFAHATAFLMAKVFESHDRTRFETVAFSWGDPPQDAMHMRLRRAFSEFHDVGAMGDEDVAALARERGIDIAVDLKGLTQNGRPGIFAARAAPLQVNYLGYPNTMGAPSYDYLFADGTLVPPADRVHYTEKVVALPHSYQANDNTRAIASVPKTRAEAGLPAQGFVFCSFNNPYKITPAVFSVWMRLLQRVPGSVLWLFQGHPAAVANLQREARERGVDPERLVFAPHLEQAEHLARHVHADLFLDTLPCNAHTTASDALWAGVPIVTCMGGAFAARVCASVLRAVGLPELVTDSLHAYEEVALALATQPARLAELRTRLAAQRLTAPLFDTERFTRDLERGFTLIHDRRLGGLPPDHVDVPAH